MLTNPRDAFRGQSRSESESDEYSFHFTQMGITIKAVEVPA